MTPPTIYRPGVFNVRPGSSNHDGRCLVSPCAERLVYVFDLGPWTMRLCHRHAFILKQALPSVVETLGDQQRLGNNQETKP